MDERREVGYRHLRYRSESTEITVCEKFSLQDNSANPRLNAVTPRTALHVAGDNAEFDAALDFILHAKPCPSGGLVPTGQRGKMLKLIT